MDNQDRKPVGPELPRPRPESGPETEPGFEGESDRERDSDGEGAESPVGQAERPQAVSPSAAAAIPPAVRTRDPLLMEVERRLEDNLWEVYASMPQQLRLRFRQEGERIARAVREGIRSGRLAAHGILLMIVRWLGMIPGVNRWFLIQEAKIKTDSLVRLARERRDGSGL